MNAISKRRFTFPSWAIFQEYESKGAMQSFRAANGTAKAVRYIHKDSIEHREAWFGENNVLIG